MTLREYLTQSGRTAHDLARQIGVAHSTVLRCADGSIEPTLATMRRLHHATDGAVTPNDFLVPIRVEPLQATGD